MKRETKRIELVETGNIATSLRRVYNGQGATGRATKRTLYNAMQLANVFNDFELTKLRLALELP